MSNTEKGQNAKTQSRAPNFFDKFFVIVTGFGFGLGTAIALLPNVIPLPIVPSIFFGTGIGALVYRFMGGFQDKDSIQTQAIKISGSLASLLSSIVLINTLLEAQFKYYIADHLKLQRHEGNGHIGIENKEGYKIGEIEKIDFNLIGYYDIDDVSIVNAIASLKTSEKGYNHPVLEKIRTQCVRNQGICEPPKNEFNLIIHSIKPETDIQEGKAIACLNSDSFWIGNENLFIYKNSNQVIKISISRFDECLDEEGQEKKILISEKDAEKLNLKSQEKIKARFQ